MTAPVHAGLIAQWRGGPAGGWFGVLIEGASGVGKSDLALRAFEAGWRLVADDRVLLWSSGGRLFGRAPGTLAGLIEARGLGVLAEPALPLARIDLVVQCVAAPQVVERLPEARSVERAGVAVPVLTLWPFEPAALAKLSRGVRHLGARA